MLTLIILILSPLFLCLLNWYTKVRYYEGYLKKIPGPSILPLIGNALELSSPKKLLRGLLKYSNDFKGCFKVYIGSQANLFFTDPKDFEFFLGSSTILTKSDGYAFVHNWLGTGLVTSTGAKWKKHRKVITPAFHFQILYEFFDVFNAQGNILIAKLKDESGKGSFDIYPFIARCTMDIICETAMGTSVNAQNVISSEYMKSIEVLLEVLIHRSYSPILANDFLYSFSNWFGKERNALKVVHGYTRGVISRKKKEYFSNIKTNDESIDPVGRKERRAFLDLLLEYSAKDLSFTEEHMREEVDTFMFAGHDTTATTMMFALHSLAKHPDIQLHKAIRKHFTAGYVKMIAPATHSLKKACEELQAIFSNDPIRSATHNDIHEMKYLEAVIKETLRIYTTVPLIGRVLEEDVDWNGMILPKGLMVNFFLYGAHHKTNSYENPQTFNPGRFTTENMKGRNPFAFVPFSAGPRNCIGQKFAMLQMKSIISNILRNFEILPPIPAQQIVLKSEGILKSENGIYLRLKNRSTQINTK